jgi:hypothetical protein
MDKMATPVDKMASGNLEPTTAFAIMVIALNDLVFISGFAFVSRFQGDKFSYLEIFSSFSKCVSADGRIIHSTNVCTRFWLTCFNFSHWVQSEHGENGNLHGQNG